MAAGEPSDIAWQRRCRVKRIKHALEAPFEWVGIGLAFLLLAALPHAVLLRLCDIAAELFYLADAKGRRRSLENLHVLMRVATGDEGTAAFRPKTAHYRPTPREALLIRGSYRNMTRTIGHIFWTSFRAIPRVRAVGVMSEPCRAFLQANRPAVTVSGHIGCWEILSQLALLEGHAMMSVAKRIGTRGMTGLLMRARVSIGQEIVAADGAMKHLLVGIRNGKSLGLLVDQRVDPENGGLWIRFCGRPLPVSAAPAFFAAKTKVPILVAWSRPLKDGRLRCEPLDVISADEARDIWRTTQRIATDLEQLMRRHPSLWVMNYNLFSNVPTERDLAQLTAREKGLST